MCLGESPSYHGESLTNHVSPYSVTRTPPPRLKTDRAARKRRRFAHLHLPYPLVPVFGKRSRWDVAAGLCCLSVFLHHPGKPAQSIRRLDSGLEHAGFSYIRSVKHCASQLDSVVIAQQLWSPYRKCRSAWPLLAMSYVQTDNSLHISVWG